MEYYKEKKQELKETLDIVKEKFPEIHVEINVECVDENTCPLYVKTILTKIYFPGFIFQPLEKERYLKSITIYATDKYFTLSFEERLSGIAHELGHMLHDTKVLNPKKLYRDELWSKQLKDLSNVSKYKAERLKKWAMLREVHADTQAAIRGHGEGTLTILKRLQPKTKEIHARISNLEKLLGKS